MTTAAARRLVLEAQISALRYLRSPEAPTEIADVAMAEEKRLKRKLDEHLASETPAVPLEDALPQAANFSVQEEGAK